MNKRPSQKPILPNSIAWLAICTLFVGIAGGRGQPLFAQVQPAEPGKPISVAIAKSDAHDDSNTLWYKSPAREWEEALPLGNGRLGAMVWGGIEREKISLNEETIWAAPMSPATTLSSEYVAVNQRKRQLAIEGKYDQVRKVTVANAGIPPDAKIRCEISGQLGMRSRSHGTKQCPRYAKSNRLLVFNHLQNCSATKSGQLSKGFLVSKRPLPVDI